MSRHLLGAVLGICFAAVSVISPIAETSAGGEAPTLTNPGDQSTPVTENYGYAWCGAAAPTSGG